eukprot:COSAG02_NODE_32195_length_520_cov_0.983373_1_plen_107_part_01
MRTKCRCAICDHPGEKYALRFLVRRKHFLKIKGEKCTIEDSDVEAGGQNLVKSKTDGGKSTPVAEQEASEDDIDNDDSSNDDNRGYKGYRCGWLPRKVLQLLLLIVS